MVILIIPPAHAGTKSTAVPTQEEAKPKRSRSIEGLASRSQSLESPFEVPAKTTRTPSSSAAKQSGEQAAQKAHHLGQKKSSTSTTVATTNSSKGAKLGQSKGEGKKKDAKKKEKEVATSSTKPPLPMSAKEKKKIGASNTASASQPSSSLQQSSKVQDKKSDVLSAVKAVKASPPASPELSKKKKRSLFSGKARARSESPERVPKSNKRASSKDSLVGGGSSSGSGHPLQAATSVKSLDRESAAVNESGPAGTNVLDIIKRYDQRDELAKSQSKPGHEKAVTSTLSSQPENKGQKADSAKKEATGKGKGQKEKSSKEDKKKEGKEGSSSKGLLSFFKRGKAHEEETSSSKQQKKKAKKDKEKEKESKQTGKESKAAAEKEPEHHHQLTIKGRIERLKESGVYTDGAEGTDANVVLVAVTKHTEEEEEVERADNLSPSQDETERSSGDAEREEGEEGDEDTDLIAEGREAETNKPEEETAQVADGGGESDEVSDAVDRVKRLQSMFQSVSTCTCSYVYCIADWC